MAVEREEEEENKLTRKTQDYEEEGRERKQETGSCEGRRSAAYNALGASPQE
jgi:hypothetical protein